ncbi:MAG TPA: hypothetical protein VJ957_01565, partial [Longimicrobiales bacterium]|nr:hypothetical protein [Longimicrobiales bacterium]
VWGVVLSPLPYPESNRIVQVDHAAPALGIGWGLGVTYGFYRFYAKRGGGTRRCARRWARTGAGWRAAP